MRQLAYVPEVTHANDGDDVLDGLRASRKRLPARLMYAGRGPELLTALARGEDYYPATIERELLSEHKKQIVAQAGPDARCVELTALDLARTHLELPVPQHAWRRTLVYLLGGAIGNLEPADARAALSRIARATGPDALLVIGADSTRDPAALLRAYDDDAGIVAELTKNALVGLNRTHAATFEPDAFEHRAVWNASACRIELSLVSRTRQIVRVAGQVITFAPGEALCIEHAYKHTPEALRMMLVGAGWRPRQVFTSSSQPYRLWLCEPQVWPQQR